MALTRHAPRAMLGAHGAEADPPSAGLARWLELIVCSIQIKKGNEKYLLHSLVLLVF
jgi:hypothetical protein